MNYDIGVFSKDKYYAMCTYSKLKRVLVIFPFLKDKKWEKVPETYNKQAPDFEYFFNLDFNAFLFCELSESDYEKISGRKPDHNWQDCIFLNPMT
ncbi:MAG: hypothetical protein Q7S92_05855 [Candidatus Diapherotrites archaeon]|nr:hypothetical protein [Candidatus Diapherotrites archaeon]